MSITPCTTDSLAITVDSLANAVAKIREQRYLALCDERNQWLFGAKKKLNDDLEQSLSELKTHTTDKLFIDKPPEWAINPKKPLILTTKGFPPEIGETDVCYCEASMEILCHSLGIKAEIELIYDKHRPRQPPSMVIKIRWPENPPSEDSLSRRKAHDLDFAKEFYSKPRMC